MPLMFKPRKQKARLGDSGSGSMPSAAVGEGGALEERQLRTAHATSSKAWSSAFCLMFAPCPNQADSSR
jgi:hypothetical protein